MSRLKEEWKPIAGFEGLYEVSDWGNVKSLARVVMRKDGRRYPVPEKILTPYHNSDGYLQVDLCENGKRTRAKVYLLVWDTFVGEDRTGLEINHIDEDKENNVVWNLNLLTHKQNINHGTRNKRSANALTNHPAMSKPVVAINDAGEVVYEFPSTAEAGRNGFSRSDVAAACRGCFNREGNHKYKGLYWHWA